MEGILVSAATGALEPVIGKLATLLGDEYKRFKGVHGEINFLTDELKAMQAFLLKMSEKEDPDVKDKNWITAVRELSYDMEDSIDDFMQSVNDKDTKPDGFIGKIKHSLGMFWTKMNDRRQIGIKVQDYKKRIIEVGKRHERYKTGVAISSTKNEIVDPRALAIYKHASELVGIDEPKAELIKLLTEEDGVASTQQQVKMVSIVGSGGMGKTTLANQVYQDLKGQFQCQAFVSVSRNPDMMKILRTIFSEVSGENYADTKAGSIQQLIGKIKDFLADKRYFIVVDDIWTNETWDSIELAFPMTSCNIIITTTRMKDVANYSCRSSGGHIYNIRPLDMKHSRQLFYRRLFGSEGNCPSNLKQVSRQILEKCDGLPLAIIAISGLLDNTEKTEYQWSQVKDSIGRALKRNDSVEKMMKILSLSYFDLPPHLKTCLLYLSIYPEDSTIEKKGLIRRWIAEGFIHKKDRFTAHEIGERCFNELINRNLIQPEQTNDYGKVKSCQVHDIILEFIISKSIEENFVTLVGVPNLTVQTQSKARRLSLQVGEQGDLIVPTGLVLSHVRSLNVFGDSVEIPCLDDFRHLRILDFGGCRQGHHLVNIGRLFQLRYLNLSDTTVSDLPEQIGHLGCLEMLNLIDTKVGELPASIVNLGKLSHLLVDKDVKFPDGIAKMQALEMLKYVGVFWQTSNFLQELGQLKNLLRLVLDFEDRYATRDIAREEAIASSLHKLGNQNLRSLTISNGNSFLQQGPLCPLPLTLQKLGISGIDVPQVPKWMEYSFGNLQKLVLNVAKVGQEGLRILGGLPNLLILSLRGKINPYKHRLTVSGKVGFPCLRQLYYVHRLIHLWFAAGAMPNLETIGIFIDTDNNTVWNRRPFDFGMKNLPRLTTIRCEVDIDTYVGTVKAAKVAMKRAARTHPNRPTLLFEHV